MVKSTPTTTWPKSGQPIIAAQKFKPIFGPKMFVATQSLVTYHVTAQKNEVFLLKLFSVNVNKSTVSNGFSHIY